MDNPAKHLLGITGGIAYASQRSSPEELQYLRSQGRPSTACVSYLVLYQDVINFRPPLSPTALNSNKNRHFLSGVKGS